MIKKILTLIFTGLFFFAISSYALEYQGVPVSVEAVQNLPESIVKQLPPDMEKRITDEQKKQTTDSADTMEESADTMEESADGATDDDDEEIKVERLTNSRYNRVSVIEEQYRHGYSSSLAGNLRQFGYDIFKSAKAKPSSLAVPDNNYILGTGDNLLIRLWGTSVDVKYTAVVDREGRINVPKLGPIPVSGVKYGEVESVVLKEAEKYIQGINISITLIKLRSLEVYVVGEVNTPGLHMVPAFSTIFDSLLHAGGVKKTGSLRKIKLVRNDKEIQTFDLYDLILKGNRKSDVTLQNKDVIFVSEIGKTAAVAGAVNNQAIFEISGKESIKDLVNLAGGALPQAFADRIYLRRFNENREFVVQDINMQTTPGAWTQLKIRDGDLLELDFMGSTLPYVVRLSGNVWKPDMYNYKPGMKLSHVLTSPDLLMPNTLTEFALIYRYDRATTRTSPMRFPLSKVFSGDYDAALSPYDKIVILSRDKIGIEENFTLKGGVWKPGTYKFEPGLKLKDALALAGGTKPEGRTDRIEVARQVKTGNNFETQYLNLDLQTDINFTLQPNDSVFIPLLKDYAVSLEGHIWNTKLFKYHEGMTLSEVLISKDLPRPEDLLQPGALMDFGLIYRYDSKTTRTKPIRFPLSEVFSRQYDTELQPLDKIVVLSRETIGIKETIHIQGAVWNSGQYNYQPGLRLKDALALAGGLKFGAGTKRVEIARQKIKNDSVETEYVMLDLDKNDGFLLEPNDSILIPLIKDAARVRKITLTGEVQYPGTYTLRENEKVSDLITRAGGFTENAYFYGAKYTSESARMIQQRGVNNMIEKLELSQVQNSSELAQTATSLEDTKAAEAANTTVQNFINKLRSIRAEGRIAIKLADLASFKDSMYDFSLQDGDTLYIPEKPAFVSVVGSVYSPGSFLYEPDRTLDFYLGKSGGVSKTADKKHVYLYKANGEIVSISQKLDFFKKFEDIILMPGDSIVVPENLDRVPYLKFIGQISDIIFKIATTAGIAFAI